MRRTIQRAALLAAMLMASSFGGVAPAECPAQRIIPIHAFSIPDTVSPEIQKAVGLSVPLPSPSPEDWKAEESRHAKAFSHKLAETTEKSGVLGSRQMMGGVMCYLAISKATKERNHNRTIIDPDVFMGEGT